MTHSSGVARALGPAPPASPELRVGLALGFRRQRFARIGVQYGAQYVGSPTIYAYAGYVRWVGEQSNTVGYVTTNIWNSVTPVAKTTAQYCVLGYANGSTHGSTLFAGSAVSTNGKSYRVQDYGVISEQTCYSNARAAGARLSNAGSNRLIPRSPCSPCPGRHA